jgi:UDP-GlcNAc3NAcA epimerase
MTILTVVGARPQFIKAAPVSRALAGRHRQILVHTGQHYDDAMSARFFRELGLPQPDRNLGIGSGPHGAQTAAMLTGIEAAILEWRPDVVLVYGDTNSTLAGALAAAKLAVPVAHVEAGLRSFDRTMPEEINRVLTDRLSARLFCPSESAAAHLRREGITEGVDIVGDVMIDQLAWAAAAGSSMAAPPGAVPGDYYLATVHRAANVDDPARLRQITQALAQLDARVVFPVHPRTRAALIAAGYQPGPQVSLVEPLGYVDMVNLQRGARAILTDSGGLQKEAYWLGVPCVTLRDETEWSETVAAGWNVLAGADAARIVAAVRALAPPPERPPLYGCEGAAARIAERLS